MVEVSDHSRTTHPYQCIGKLLFTKTHEHYTGTAFAVSVKGAKNIIFTSACNLYDEKGQATSIEFIPAIRNDGSQPHGSFKQLDGGKGAAWFVHPNWNPITKPCKYDLGAIKIGKNKAGKDLGDIISLLDVDFDVTLAENDTKWNIVWYSQLRMFQSEARFTKLLENSNGVISTHNSAMMIPLEAFGAPWITSNGANGHYAGQHKSDTGAAKSPYYNLGLIREVLNQM